MLKPIVLLLTILLPLVIMQGISQGSNPPIMSYQAELWAPSHLTANRDPMNMYMLPHAKMAYNSIVFGASKLDLEGLDKDIDRPFSSWELKLTNISDSLGLQLKIEESLIIWKIEVNYLIIDKTKAQIFPVVESLKMTPKSLMKKTDSPFLLTFVNNQHITSQLGLIQSQVIVITFLRGFAVKQGQNKQGKFKINLQNAIVKHEMIQFNNQIEGIKSYQITVLIINRASLLKTHFLIQQIPGLELPSNHHLVSKLNILKSVDISLKGNMELKTSATMDQSRHQLGLLHIQCPENTKFNEVTGQCDIVEIQMETVLTKQERVLDSSSCYGSTCPTLVTCPSYLTAAIKCYSINGAIKVKTCSAGYYTTSSLANSCTLCSLPNCLECALSYTTNTLGCTVCANGYALKNGVCQICHSGCLTCSYNLAGIMTCLTCNTAQGFILRTSGTVSLCECPTNKYRRNTPLPVTCIPCNSPCRTCSSASACITCVSEFYLSGSSCLPCMKVCRTCTSPSICTTCFSTGILPADMICTCTTGLFFDTLTKSCRTCQAKIANCQVCDYNGTYNPVNPPNIICLQAQPSYYIDNGTGLISSCLSNCLNCTTGADCITCKANFVFDSTLCVCNATYYYNSANYQCQSCSQVIQGCSSCNTLVIPNPTTCNQCMVGYYPSMNVSDPYCLKCDNLCENCTGPSLCLNCTNNLIIDNGDCVCNYSLGQFLHPISHICYLCNQIVPNCLLCSSSADVTCLQCNLNYYPDPTAKFCLPCPINCKNCTNLTFCSDCQPGYTIDNSSNLCVCDNDCQMCLGNHSNTCSLCDPFDVTICQGCAPGYFNQSSICVRCQSATLSYCQQCSGNTTCLTCRSSFLMLANGTCDCDNTNNFYITNNPNQTLQTCLLCDQIIANCNQCQNDAVLHQTYCTSCQNEFYVINDTCAPCSHPCANCNITDTNCLTCALTYILQNGSCTCQNDLMIFEDSRIQGCRPCSLIYDGCNNCTTDNSSIGVTCLTCDGAKFFNSITLQCQNCPQQCSTCLDYNTCISCKTGFVEIGFQCVCNNSAIPPVYLSPLSRSCLKCQQIISGCTNCAYSTTVICNQCLGGTYLANNICNPCPITCTTCNSTQCLSCPLGLALYTGTCQCENTCTQCSLKSASCLQCNIINDTVTACLSCLSGSYVSGAECLSCPSTCASCTSKTQCLTCRSNFVISSSGICQCLTQQGLFSYNSQCKRCENIIFGCTQCDTNTNSETICTSCTEGYYLSSDQCLVCSPNCLKCDLSATNCIQCKDGLTILANGTCSCQGDCLGCQASSNSLSCVDCLYNIYGDFLYCEQCSGGFYLYNQTCAPCPSDCLTCDAAGKCISCANTFQVINGSCLCNIQKNFWPSNNLCIKCDNVYSFCQVCVTDNLNTHNFTCSQCLLGYYSLNNTCVASVCSDKNITSGEECDDGNVVDGDGCNKFCLIQPFFICTGAPSVCSVDVNFKLALYQIKVDPIICNQVKVSFTLEPILPAYDTADFSKILNYIKSVQVNYNNWLSWSYSSGLVSYTFAYQENLQNKNVQFFFAPEKLNILQTKKMPIVVITVDFNSTNNIPAFLVDNSTCKSKELLQAMTDAVQYSSYAIMAASALPCKIVGLELFGVLQLAHLSIGNIDNVNTMLTPLMGLKGVHGPTVKLSDKQKSGNRRRLQSGGSLTPDRVQSIGYSANFLRNCNLMFLITVGIMALSFSLFIVIKLCKTCSPLCYSFMSRIAKQLLLTLILFNCYNFAYSAGIHYRYASANDELYTLGTLTATLTLIIPIIMCIILAISQEKGFGEFKDKLKQGILEKSYFIITILYRTGMGLYVSTMNEDQQSALIVIAISILFLLYNLINLPFTKAYHNYRANVCHISQFICLFITLYYRSMTSSKQSIEVSRDYTPVYIYYSCIMLSFAVSFFIMLYEIYLFIKECCISKQTDKQAKKVDQTEIEDDNLKFQKSIQNDQNKILQKENTEFHIDLDMMRDYQNQ